MATLSELLAATSGDGFVIGIDLSLTGTGLADFCLDTRRFTAMDTHRTKGKRTDNYKMRGDRLTGIADHIVEWATAGPLDPRLVAIEGPSLGNRQGSQFDRSGLWWLVVSALQAGGIPVLVVPPKTRAKYATGNGNADKATVVAHVVEQYGDFCGRRIANDNEADAVVLAAIGARYIGRPQEDDLPESNLSAMSGVEAL